MFTSKFKYDLKLQSFLFIHKDPATLRLRWTILKRYTSKIIFQQTGFYILKFFSKGEIETSTIEARFLKSHLCLQNLHLSQTHCKTLIGGHSTEFAVRALKIPTSTTERRSSTNGDTSPVKQVSSLSKWRYKRTTRQEELPPPSIT